MRCDEFEIKTQLAKEGDGIRILLACLLVSPIDVVRGHEKRRLAAIEQEGGPAVDDERLAILRGDPAQRDDVLCCRFHERVGQAAAEKLNGFFPGRLAGRGAERMGWYVKFAARGHDVRPDRNSRKHFSISRSHLPSGSSSHSRHSVVSLRSSTER